MRIWNVASGEEMTVLQHEGTNTSALAFSPDGTRLAVCEQWPDAMRIWDISIAEEVAVLRGVDSCKISQDGTKLVAHGNETLHIWDLISGQEQLVIDYGTRYSSISFSPDAKLLVIEEDDILRLWNIEVGEELMALPFDYLSNMTFSPDGTLLAITRRSDVVHLWDVDNGVEVAPLYHEGLVEQVLFSPNDRVLATTSTGTVFLWDASNGEKLLTFQHEGEVKDVMFSSDSTRLAARSDDTIWLTDVNKQVEFALHHEGEDAPSILGFSPDGTSLLTESNQSMHLWDTSNGEHLLSIPHEKSEIGRIFFDSKEEKLISIPGYGGAVHVWDKISGTRLFELPLKGRIDAAVLGPDGQTLATSSEANTIHLWDAKTGGQTRVTHLEGDEITNAMFSSDGAKLITIPEWHGAVQLFDVRTGEALVSLPYEGVRDQLDGVIVSADGERLATVSDTVVSLWNISSGKELFSVALSETLRLDQVILSPKADLLAVLVNSFLPDYSTIRVWDVSSGRETIITLQPQEAWYSNVVFSPDSTVLATVVFVAPEFMMTSGQNTVHLWELPSGKELTTLEHDGSVGSVVFSNDGAWLATEANNTVRLWHTRSGQAMAAVHYYGAWHSEIILSPDGSRLATVGSGGEMIHLWTLEPTELMKLACHVLTRNLTRREWDMHLGTARSYRPTCPQGSSSYPTLDRMLSPMHSGDPIYTETAAAQPEEVHHTRWRASRSSSGQEQAVLTKGSGVDIPG